MEGHRGFRRSHIPIGTVPISVIYGDYPERSKDKQSFVVKTPSDSSQTNVTWPSP